MTLALEEAGFTPARELPNGKLFWSPHGLFEFQAEGVAESYIRTEPGAQSGVVAVWDTGIGKTFLGMGLASYLMEDNQIDLVMVIAEKNKITDWRDDFTRNTAFSVHRYHGSGRQKRLAREKNLHVFITTYETGRNELVTRRKVKGHRAEQRVDGPLVEALGLRNKRVLWIFDEVTRLRGRSSELHHAYDYILRALRKGPHHQRVLGLTATPMERDFEDAYNVGRIVCPERMPTVAKFEETFVDGLDSYGRYKFRKDRELVFAALFQGIAMRKRKTDQDVIDQFPKQVEKSIWVDLHAEHAELYRATAALFEPDEGETDNRSDRQVAEDDRRLWGIQRLTAGHPLSHLYANNEISRAISETIGTETLKKIPSSKTEALQPMLKEIVKGQGAQVVIFTFFGNTVLRALVDDLRALGYSTVEFHGGRTLKQNDDAIKDFKRKEVSILVTSDAGSRGLNLQNAEYVVEYEAALTHANRIQRINRIHRIDSDHPLVTCYTMIASDTVEEGIMNKMLRRNEQQDMLLGDDDDGTDYITAAQRREMLEVTRSGRRRR